MNRLASIFRRANKFAHTISWRGVNGRNMSIYPDDVFLVGYPKSGNTWLNFLIACLRADNSEDVNFDSVERYVADIYTNSPSALRNLTRPRFLKSHELFDSRYSKVVYIVRDPRAVAVSYYHYLIGVRRIVADYPIEQFIPEFIQGSFDNFGTWEENVRGWLTAHKKDAKRVMIVKYEDFQAAAQVTLSDITKHVQIEASSEEIWKALSWSSPQNMRKLEIEGRRLGYPGVANFREGSFFVRGANSFGWKQELDSSLEEQIEDAWADVMQELGYI